jgi:hypothetical protein
MRLQAVRYAANRALNYPTWFLEGDDKEIANAVRCSFPWRFRDEDLLRSYRTLNMVPDDLRTLFASIQGGAS